MLSLKVMLVLVFILLSIEDTTIAHTTHHQEVKQKIGVNEAGNGTAKLGEKEVYDGHSVPLSIEVIGRGRKEMEEGNKEDSKNSVATMQSKLSSYGKVNRESVMALTAADYHMATTHPPRNN